jgi:hypothetical protein
MSTNTRVTYYAMRPGKGFLAGIKVGPDEDIEAQDVEEAEEWAKEEIDEFLGLRFDNSDLDLVPKTIRQVAQKLAAKFVLDIAERNSDTHAGIRWEKEARLTLMDLRQGRRGLKMTDGSWHFRFPGNWNSEEGREGGLQIISG